ncbi:hypothetical protein EVAR_23975_1 [Eumeta japonica]|uniref:Histone-lysine N-methyltransferase SETMAR n=1 Tax=Eumeta variegata TaxID=151549 RepID=A0A4C1V1B3_EUMVA|nr:hypothetical protein EVAR_23975_1 [Eumeta japonica]
MNHVLICNSLLKRNEAEPVLQRLITGDEKWITCDKNVKKIMVKRQACSTDYSETRINSQKVDVMYTHSHHTLILFESPNGVQMKRHTSTLQIQAEEVALKTTNYTSAPPTDNRTDRIWELLGQNNP